MVPWHIRGGIKERSINNKFLMVRCKVELINLSECFSFLHLQRSRILLYFESKNDNNFKFIQTSKHPGN